MTVREAVTRAMRGDRLVTTREFPAVQDALLEGLTAQAISDGGGYLISTANAEIMRTARFRNDAERREFYVGFIGRAREQMEIALLRTLRTAPEANRASLVACTRGSEAVSCFAEEGGTAYLWASSRSGGLINGMIRYLHENLPSPGFRGISSLASGALTAIQLLDGVEFKAENYAAANLPAETQISVSRLRVLFRTQVPGMP